MSVKTLKRMLKKAGLKTSGRKGALTRRVKKAHLKMGGSENEVEGGRRRRSRRGGAECGPDEDAAVTGCTVTTPMDAGRRRRRGSRKY